MAEYVSHPLFRIKRMAQTGHANNGTLTALSAANPAGAVAQLWRTVGLSFALLLCCRTPGLGQFTLPPDFEAPSRSSCFSFDLEQHHAILVPVEIGGETVDLLLDTGASHHLLDNRYEPRLGQPLYEKQAETGTPGVNVTVKAFRPPRMLIGQLSVPNGNRPIGLFDCSALSGVLDADVNGVLAAPLLNGGLLTLNFDDGVATLSDNSAAVASAEASLPLSFGPAGTPHLPDVEVGDSKLDFLIDTGRTGSVTLMPEVFQHLLDEGLITELHTGTAMTAAGVVDHRVGTLGEIRIGPFKHERIHVSEAAQNSIGLKYLSRFLMIIDAENRQLHLSKGAKFDEPEDVPISCGVSFKVEADGAVVSAVDPGSPGDVAGVRVGDQLLAVNDLEPTGSSMIDARRLLCGEPGTSIQLLYSRDGVEMQARLKIQPYSKWGKATTDPGGTGR